MTRIATVTAKPYSPTWHRRLRAQRSKARHLIASSRLKLPAISKGRSQRLLRAFSLLESHHSRPGYDSIRLMTWKQSKGWYGAPKWDARSPQQPLPKKKGADKDKDKDKSKESIAMAYDAGPWLGSGSSASSSATIGGDVQARAFMEAFMEYAKEKEQDLPPALQAFVQPNVKDHLRSQQKRLNKHRGLLQKIEAKKRAIQRDQEQWNKWTSDMKEHIACQKKRHQEQEEKLQSELRELEKEEEAIRNMKDPEEEEVVTIPEGDEDIEDMLDEVMDDADTKKMADIEKTLEKKQMELEAEYQRRYKMACTQMEQQYQAQVLNMISNVSPPPGFGELPKEVQEAANTPVKTGVGPFQRAPKDSGRKQNSPYARNVETEETMQKKLQETHGDGGRNGQG